MPTINENAGRAEIISVHRSPQKAAPRIAVSASKIALDSGRASWNADDENLWLYVDHA
jgi:hypothetical protein